MLCAECNSIFAGGAKRYPSPAEEYFHHTSAQSFKKAIADGCRLCEMLMNMLPSHIQQLDWEFQETNEDEAPIPWEALSLATSMVTKVIGEAPDTTKKQAYKNINSGSEDYLARQRLAATRYHDCSRRMFVLSEQASKGELLPNDHNILNCGFPWELNNTLIFSRDQSFFDPSVPGIQFFFVSAKGRIGLNSGSRSMPWEIYLINAKLSAPISSQKSLPNSEDYRLLSKSTADLPVWQLAQQWLTRCNETHQELCASRDETFLPSRLLRLVRSKCSQYEDLVQLCLPRLDASVKGPYMTLTHRWRDPSHMTMMTAANMQELLSGIPLGDLSITFQDALRFAKLCGVDYVWIDALCIQQGENQDLQRELDSMDMIYHEAYCNLSAAGPPTNGTGLFHHRKSNSHLPLCVSLSEFCWTIGEDSRFDKYTCIPRDLWQTAVEEAVVNTRGWVCQERYLSKRKVFFADQQIFWECRTMKACETFQASIPRQLLSYSSRGALARMHVSPEEEVDKMLLMDKIMLASQSAHHTSNSSTSYRLKLLRFWRWFLQKYSHLQLTHETDRFLAMKSITRHLETAFQDDLVYGLWRKELPYQLIFEYETCTNIVKQDRNLQVPSWSWAFLRRGLKFCPDSCWNEKDVMSPLVTILDIKHERIRLRGFLLSCCPELNNRDQYDMMYRTGALYVWIDFHDIKFRMMLKLEDMPVPLSDKNSLHILPIYRKANRTLPSWKGLVLLKIADLNDQKSYHRVGICSGTRDVYEAFEAYKNMYMFTQVVAHLT